MSYFVSIIRTSLVTRSQSNCADSHEVIWKKRLNTRCNFSYAELRWKCIERSGGGTNVRSRNATAFWSQDIFNADTLAFAFSEFFDAYNRRGGDVNIFWNFFENLVRAALPYCTKKCRSRIKLIIGLTKELFKCTKACVGILPDKKIRTL